MSDIRKTIVVAVAENGVIGRDGDMPWRLSTDLKRFKAMTLGKPLVVGRKTYESFGKPLPGRPHVVISRHATIEQSDVTMARSFPEAIGIAERLARDTGQTEIIIAGGGEIYAQAMALADRMCVTHVQTHVAGDTSFPSIDPADWMVVEEIDVPAGEKDNYPTRFAIYERRSA
ncbi:dihydrofolate reductase [Rhizobium mongolense subsp. loessense]|uniref:Dihydrofolate reductase n=1 Tax=Rhizobium mongolense subsp. loessense TaxID=158890 RepID=A0A1G4RFT4_9HYPH|nr:dihydrofolate reductase [Rhizobium mongolense]SCW55792.1 dihydrofolate reductase [Rhizobium mongolense subsp. loessense]